MADIKQGRIAQAELEAQAKEDQSHYGVFLAKLEDIKTEFIRAITDAHPAGAAAFVQALTIRNEAAKRARVKYLAKTNTKTREDNDYARRQIKTT